MLLIWDIHLTTKNKDKLLSQLKKYIEKNDNEKNLIFLWDYVYHFSYDRNALLELYDLFLELYLKWKNLYILAWNHDRLGNMFVFEEWKKSFELISKILNKHENEICFITNPEIKEIEWKKFLFLPSTLEIREQDYEWIEELKNDQYLEDIKNKNKNIVFSSKLNLILEWFVKKYENLVVIHHYYIEWVSFPWQQSKFWFKDKALSKHRLDNKNIQIISGHLHQSFSFKNYFCTWSIRATSPLEINQIKYFWKRDWNNFEWEETNINYYFFLERPSEWVWLFDERKRSIEEKDIISHRNEKQKESNNNFKWNSQIYLTNDNNLDLKWVSVSIHVDKLQYDNMTHFIDQNLQEKLQNVQLKKETAPVEKILNSLENPNLSWNQSFWDWLQLLKNLLQKKYPEEYSEYEKILYEINIFK